MFLGYCAHFWVQRQKNMAKLPTFRDGFGQSEAGGRF